MVFPKLSVLNGAANIGLFPDSLIEIIEENENSFQIEVECDKSPIMMAVDYKLLFNVNVKPDSMRNSGTNSIDRIGQIIAYVTEIKIVCYITFIH